MHEAGVARFCQLVPKIPHLSRRNSSQVCDIFLGSVSAPWGAFFILLQVFALTALEQASLRTLPWLRPCIASTKPTGGSPPLGSFQLTRRTFAHHPLAMTLRGLFGFHRRGDTCIPRPEREAAR